MKEILYDIRDKLLNGAFKNEEHVRLSIVSRILKSLGWNIWNPNEVYAEYKVLPHENLSRVDLALFQGDNTPCVYIETKAVGKLEGNIRKIEKQLRDYNVNFTALFSVITDGRSWRLYYVRTGGEFAQKCFKSVDLLKDNVDDIENSFETFLSKEEILHGNADFNAKKYLNLTRTQQVLEASISEAQRIVLEPPYLSLPQALKKIAETKGLSTSIEEIETFLKNNEGVPVKDDVLEVESVKKRSIENEIELCRNKATGVNFIYLENIDLNRIRVITPNGRILIHESEHFSEVFHEDKTKLLSKGLITPQQLDLYDEYENNLDSNEGSNKNIPIKKSPTFVNLSIKVNNTTIKGESVPQFFTSGIEYIVSKNLPIDEILPFRTSAVRFLIARRPIHPRGNDFVNPVEYSGYFMEAHKNRKEAKRNLILLFSKLGCNVA